MKIMLDVNVLIDYLQKRESHYHYSSLAIKAVLQEAAIGFIPALAESSGCDYIVTRNVPDFKHSPIPAITPEEFIRKYALLP